MPGTKRESNPAMELVMGMLRANKNTPYAEIAAAARKKRLVVYPVNFGRAKVLLGLVSEKRDEGMGAQRGPVRVLREATFRDQPGTRVGLGGMGSAPRPRANDARDSVHR